MELIHSEASTQSTSIDEICTSSLHKKFDMTNYVLTPNAALHVCMHVSEYVCVYVASIRV